MKTRYRAYQESLDDCLSVSVYPESSEARAREAGLLRAGAQLLWEIEADTWEEAQAIHYLRMGYGPYKPMGECAPCPKCGSFYYPEGSGECWRCG